MDQIINHVRDLNSITISIGSYRDENNLKSVIQPILDAARVTFGTITNSIDDGTMFETTLVAFVPQPYVVILDKIPHWTYTDTTVITPDGVVVLRIDDKCANGYDVIVNLRAWNSRASIMYQILNKHQLVESILKMNLYTEVESDTEYLERHTDHLRRIACNARIRSSNTIMISQYSPWRDIVIKYWEEFTSIKLGMCYGGGAWMVFSLPATTDPNDHTVRCPIPISMHDMELSDIHSSIVHIDTASNVITSSTRAGAHAVARRWLSDICL